MTLKELYEFPTELLKCEARDLHALLGGPTLVHLPGRQTPALVVSTLLHGNETSGWDAIRALLREKPDLQRNVMVLIGNGGGRGRPHPARAAGLQPHLEACSRP